MNPRPPAFAASFLPLDHEGFKVENEQAIKLKVLIINKTKFILKPLDDIKFKRFDLRSRIELIPEGFCSLIFMPDGIWRAPLWRNTFKVF